jgi:phosphoribosylanthranilate isomerase
MAPFIKICGITRVDDAQHAVRHGATALGFVFWPRSPRAVTVAQARAIVDTVSTETVTVGVFVNESAAEIARVVAATGLTAVQLHGDESPAVAAGLTCPLLRSVDLARADAVERAWPEPTVLLLDVYDPERRGGTGTVVDWTRAAVLARRRRVVLAGGLGPSTVAAAIAAVRPFGVDVSSGVEQSPGIKDSEKVALFLERARTAFDGGRDGAQAPSDAGISGGVVNRGSH